jgi:hypothetical protein
MRLMLWFVPLLPILSVERLSSLLSSPFALTVQGRIRGAAYAMMQSADAVGFDSTRFVLLGLTTSSLAILGAVVSAPQFADRGIVSKGFVSLLEVGAVALGWVSLVPAEGPVSVAAICFAAGVGFMLLLGGACAASVARIAVFPILEDASTTKNRASARREAVIHRSR